MKIQKICVNPLYTTSQLQIDCDKADIRALQQLSEQIGTIDPNKEYDIKIAPVKKSRSLDANAYMWVLSDRLAKVLRTTKEEIYRKAIRDVGVWDYINIKDDAVESFIEKWNGMGTGYLAEYERPAKNGGSSVVRAYYGSHTYDTAQMSRLIDYIVDECKSQGIETMANDFAQIDEDVPF